MNHLIPTVFSHNKKEFDERFKKATPISKKIHIDFMDGKFVKAKSVNLSQIPDLKKYSNYFEAHLMTKNPEAYIKKLKEKGFKKIIFHISSTKNPEKVVESIRKEKLIPYLAINPEENLKEVIPYLKVVSGIMIMGVHPGIEHQEFIKEVYKKIESLRKIDKKIKIQVDGGVNKESIAKLARLGVNYINSGSYVSGNKDPKRALKELNSICYKNKR